jgi:hypothetical protein
MKPYEMPALRDVLGNTKIARNLGVGIFVVRHGVKRSSRHEE